MTDKGLEMVAVADDELRLVRGGRSFWVPLKQRQGGSKITSP
jgi:hypothetical protein